jgi:hypothetical protein
MHDFEIPGRTLIILEDTGFLFALEINATVLVHRD